MLASYLLSLREGFEAALIIGIVLGALRKIRRQDLAPALWLGVLTASIISIATAILLTAFGLEMEDPGEAIFEGATMLLAAGILTWMVFWMSQQARHIKSELEEGVNKAAASTGRRALFWLAFVAVVREGIELALFLAAAVFASSAQQTLPGSVLGIGTAILLSWSLFASILRLDLRRFFQVTGILLILFAAGLIAHGVHEFTEVGWIPSLVEHIWNMHNIISDESLLGQLLYTLFGYNSSPTLAEMIAYFVYLAGVMVILNRTSRKTEEAIQPQA